MSSTSSPACNASRVTALGALVLLAATGCGAVPQQASAPGSMSELRSRALAIPRVASDSTCPTSPYVQIRTGYAVPPPAGTPIRNKGIPGYGYGAGPVYLTGQVVGLVFGQMQAPGWFAGQIAQIVVDPSYSGPVLIRGHQADGPGGFPLDSPGGEVTFAGALPSADYRKWGGPVVGPPGCYALQVDTDIGTSLIWFLVVAGSPPPG